MILKMQPCHLKLLVYTTEVILNVLNFVCVVENVIDARVS